VPRALEIVRRYRLTLVGIHMHIGSGVDYAHLSRVCGTMVEVVGSLGHDIEAISAGGGLPVPYCEGDIAVDTEHYFRLWDDARQQIEACVGHAVRIEIERGRFLLAESGVLVTEVHATNVRPEHNFVLVDAGFNDLMRPSLYGSYHNVTVLGPGGMDVSHRASAPVVIAGPLCEAGDVFTQEAGGVVKSRMMPEPEVGDLLVIHDTGAYGASMSSNYNTRLLAPEVLLDGGNARLIRRRQTIGELLALEELP
jgi:diaminopimelate decarboxylase